MVLKRVFSGLTVVTVGVILLANTTGALPWSVWWNILALWPLLLVAAGIDILGKALGSGILRALGSLIVLAGLVYGALAGAPGVPQLPVPLAAGGTARPFSFARPHDASVTHGDAHISAGLGTLTLKTGEQLVTAEGRTPFGAPQVTVAGQGQGGVRVDVGVSGQPNLRFGYVPRSFINVTLDQFVLWENLQVEAGLSRTALDLSRLHVRSATVDAGLSQVEATLGRPWEGNEQVTVKAGMSNVTLRVPADVVSEIEIDNGLGTTHVGPEWERVGDSGDVWRSKGAGSAPVQLRVKVEAGLSTVRIGGYAAPRADGAETRSAAASGDF